MTTGGYDPSKEPYNQGGEPDPQQGGYPPPPGSYPPPGNYPPPQGNYPPAGGYPPPQGNYPPPQGHYPPPGGYPPPPGNYPPQGGYPPPPGNYPPGSSQYGGFGAPTQLNVGEAIGYGWKKFSQNAGVWIAFVVAAALIQFVINVIFGGFDTNELSALSIIGAIVSVFVSILIQAAYVRGALHETDGNRPSFGSFFQFENIGAVVVASLLVSLMTVVGFILLIIPGFIVIFLTWWTLQFVIDRNEQPVDAIKSSFRAISSNVGPLLLLALALVGINILGAIPCGLGLLVTIPLTIIASTYAYRVTTGRGVAP